MDKIKPEQNFGVANPKTADIQAVNIKGLDIGIWDMTIFMVKWAIASIPAMIILAVLGTIMMGVIGGLFR